MSKRRKTIRKRLIQILKGSTDAGNRVFENQSVPAWVEELPVILVYPRSEDASKFNQAPLEFKRDVTFGIEIVASGTEPPFDEQKGEDSIVADILDNIGEQVECAIFRDDTLGCDEKGRAIADEVLLASTEFEYRADGEKTIGAARLSFIVTYFEHAPESVEKQAGLSDFKIAKADWHVGHHDDEPDLTDIEAQDDIVIPSS